MGEGKGALLPGKAADGFMMTKKSEPNNEVDMALQCLASALFRSYYYIVDNNQLYVLLNKESDDRKEKWKSLVLEVGGHWCRTMRCFEATRFWTIPDGKPQMFRCIKLMLQKSCGKNDWAVLRANWHLWQVLIRLCFGNYSWGRSVYLKSNYSSAPQGANWWEVKEQKFFASELPFLVADSRIEHA